MASAVTPRLASAFKSFGLKAGLRSPTRIAPLRILWISVLVGAATFRTMSDFQAATAVTILAPALA